MEVNDALKQPGYKLSSKYLPLCSAEQRNSYRFGTTNKQMSPDLNIPSQFNSNDFMNFFTDKIDNIRNTITNVDSYSV